MRLYVLGFIFTGETANSTEDHINHVMVSSLCVLVCVCVCVSLNVVRSGLRYVVISGYTLYTHTHVGFSRTFGGE